MMAVSLGKRPRSRKVRLDAVHNGLPAK